MIRRKPRRLGNLPTLWIDPARRLRFRFGLGWYRAFAGDTIATALFRSGVSLFSRSPRLHRPRGLWGLDGETGHTRVEVDGMPDVSAETTPVREGMSVFPQIDRFSLIPGRAGSSAAGPGGRASRFRLPFLSPEIADRESAGGGIDPDFRTVFPAEVRHLHCEVCVIGGGPAGMTAALAAADQGLRVILLERRARLGGHFAWRESDFAPGVPLFRRADYLARELGAMENVRLFTGTAATRLLPGERVDAVRTGGAGDRFLSERLEIRARSVVLASGDRERFAVFENNDRPGIMTADTALRLARLYGVLPGRRAVLAVADDAGLNAALELHALGLVFSAVADRRPDGAGSRMHRALEDRGLLVLGGWVPAGAGGRKRVRSAHLASLDGAEEHRFPCDLLVASEGRTPTLDLWTGAGGAIRWDPEAEDWRPGEPPARVHPAGALLGIDEPSAREASGWRAGLEAAADNGAAVEPDLARYRLLAEMAPRTGSSGDSTAGWRVKGARRSFVRTDEDIVLDEVLQAVRAGFDTPETAMRWIGVGAGTGQAGDAAGEILGRALAWARGVSPADVPPFPARPPAAPVSAGVLAAGRRDPVRRTPLVDRMRDAGALCARIGDWSVTARYGADRLASDELAAIRAGVGLMDASALGKFRVFGPGAKTALHRVCVNHLARLAPGQAVPAVMCHPDGHPLDMGELALHDRDDYFLVTRPERAHRVEEWIRRFAPPDAPPFHVVDLTDALATLILAGAYAREILQRVARYNVSPAALPVMGYRWFSLRETLPVRLIRTDALARPCFALHFPASLAEAAWDLLMEAGADFGMCPFGEVAAATLRVRRGGIDPVREAEPRTTLVDLRLGKLWDLERTTPRPLGEDAWRRAMDPAGRMKRVLFQLVEGDAPPPDGSVVVEGDRPAGRVCLSRFHPDLGVAVGSALVPDRLAEPGTRLTVAVVGDEEEEGLEIEVRELDRLGKRVA